MKLFYDHLTELDSVRPHLERYLPDVQHIDLVVDEIDSAITHEVMRVILDKLPHHKHEEFILAFKNDPRDEHHLVYLRQFEPEIETHIVRAGRSIRQRFIDAVHE